MDVYMAIFLLFHPSKMCHYKYQIAVQSLFVYIPQTQSIKTEAFSLWTNLNQKNVIIEVHSLFLEQSHDLRQSHMIKGYNVHNLFDIEYKIYH